MISFKKKKKKQKKKKTNYAVKKITQNASKIAFRPLATTSYQT